jgi:uncharacterized protein YcfJ
MKRAIALTLIGTCAFAAQAQPAASAAFTERARVQSAEPQYETVQVPREECSSQWITEAQPNRGANGIGGAVVGGATGAILGAQVGKGNGRDAAIAAGAVIGAITGDRLSNRDVVTAPTYEQREVRSCRTVSDVQQRVAGWRVTYEYGGRLYTTVMRRQPGNTIPVRVSVTPVDEAEYHRPY